MTKNLREIKNHTLYFDGCNMKALAEKYGTPLYVYSESDIVSRFEELKSCFTQKYENTRVAYAAKAFCTLAMLRLVHREGMCVDVVSGGELYTAMKAGFPPECIEFNGNNKLYKELEMAVDYGIGRIIVDGLSELSAIEDICSRKNKKMNVLFRITPGVKSDSHDYIVTGKKDSKFGIPLDDEILFPLVEQAVKSKYVNFLGFHFHVGSQLFSNRSYLEALDIVLELSKKIRKNCGCEIKELNVGGGFGITYTNEERKPYSYFLDAMMEKITRFFESEGARRPAVVIEPGRSIVGEAGITLYTIGSIKEIPGVRKYVSVDGGMTDNIRPALYQAVYDGMVANRADSPKTDKVTVCGKCCESGDILIRDIEIPQAEPGDVFAVFSTGAYGYSMASNYNKIGVPPVVFVREGKDTLVVKGQSYEDLIRNEI